MQTESARVVGHFLRAKAAAIPPAMRPTAVAVMPIPITPSAKLEPTKFSKKKKGFKVAF